MAAAASCCEALSRNSRLRSPELAACAALEPWSLPPPWPDKPSWGLRSGLGGDLQDGVVTGELREEDVDGAFLTFSSSLMVDHAREHEALEHILTDASEEPIMLSYAILKHITNNFSRLIGRGGFGEVYMGVLKNWKVAVKKLSKTDEFSEKQFEDEVTCLIRVKHKNIVRFLGYCSDTQKQVVSYNGKYVMAEVRQRLLCFEYAPNKTLYDYLKDESHKCEWDVHYLLIKGICEGLQYLHKVERINHLDLKPGNILLDADMVPKITDFGLSRRFGGEESRIFTKTICTSPGYTAPEYQINGEISFKSDIFSLGVVIINILCGSNDFYDMEHLYKSLNMEYHHVKRCFEIARICMDSDHHKRPTIDYIIDELGQTSPIFDQSMNNPNSSKSKSQNLLDIDCSQVKGLTGNVQICVNDQLEKQVQFFTLEDKMETTSIKAFHALDESSENDQSRSKYLVSSSTEELLEVDRRELQFTFVLKKKNTCSVNVTNKTDSYIAFKVKTKQIKKYSVRPNINILPPRAKCTVVITMGMQTMAPPDFVCNDKFLLQSTIVKEGFRTKDINKDTFSEGTGKVVSALKLTVVYVAPPQSPLEAFLNPIKQEKVSPNSVELLETDRQELEFPFALKKRITCSLNVTNKTDSYVAFNLKTTQPKKYIVQPNKCILFPRAKRTVIITMDRQTTAPPDFVCSDKFLLLSTIVIEGFSTEDIDEDTFSEGTGKVVNEVKLMVVYVVPPQSPLEAFLNLIKQEKVSPNSVELLETDRQELEFMFVLKKRITCSLNVTNKTDSYVAFNLKTTQPKKYIVQPNKCILFPRAKRTVIITMDRQTTAPPDFVCSDKFLLLSTIVIEGFSTEDIDEDTFSEGTGKVVNELKLMVVYVAPSQSP